MKKGLDMEIRSGPWSSMEKWKTHPYLRKVEVLSAATHPHPTTKKEKKKTYSVETSKTHEGLFTSSLPKFSRPI